MRIKHVLKLSFIPMLLCFSMVLRADAPHARLIANDPAFDSLVNAQLLQEAAEGKNAEIMVDAAIMLERAEQTLRRPHRGGTADDMFRYAWRTANVYGDKNAQERIRQHLQYYKRDALLRELEGLRYVAPEMPKRPDYPGGSEQELYNDFMSQAEDALRRLDMREAKELQQQANDPQCPLTAKDKDNVCLFLEQVTTKIFKATHNDDGSPKREVQPWGWNHGPASQPPAQEEPNWGPVKPRNGVPIAPSPASPTPYRSKVLKALFIKVPHGAKIVAIFPGSPLQGRLRTGDIITMLDSVPVQTTWELENHHSTTLVDYMDQRGLHQRTMIRIQNYR